MNNLNAQIALGDIYLNDKTAENGPQKAFDLYMNASLNGNPLASYKVAMMYKNGTGVGKDMEKYREFLKMSVEEGNREGILESRNPQ